MGRKTPGIAPEPNGTWSVDKVWRGRRLRRRGFVDHEEAQGWLIAQMQRWGQVPADADLAAALAVYDPEMHDRAAGLA